MRHLNSRNVPQRQKAVLPDKNAVIQIRAAYHQARCSAYTPKEFHGCFMKMGMIPPGFYRESFLADARR